jgi:hypothetical protein
MKKQCKRCLPARLAMPILLTLLLVLFLAACGGKDNAPTASTEAPYTGDLGALASDYTGSLPDPGVYTDTFVPPPTIQP